VVVVDLTVLADDPYPAVSLIVAGLLSLLVAIYGRRDDSYLDEVGTFFAFVIGGFMFVMAFFAGTEGAVGWFTIVVMVALGMTMFLKPLKEIPWSALLGAIVGGVAALVASLVLPSTVFGIDEWIILLLIFFIVGAIIHGIFHFMEDVLTLATVVLSWKPFTILIALVALAEGVMLYLDSSLMSFL
jgi:hypothetical protein